MFNSVVVNINLSDEYTQMATPAEKCFGNHDNKTIPPIRDIPISIVNKQMYGI